MITPLMDRDRLDAAGLERLIEHVLGGGVHALFILGTTGEAPSLSHRIRRELVERTVRQVAGRVPVLVGITDTSFVESVELARFAAETGAQAVVTSAPYYFPAGQPELIEYLDHLVAALPLPMLLYNMPRLTKVDFHPDTVRWALGAEKIVGMKDSSGDMIYFHSLLPLIEQRPDWSLLIGPEELLAEAMLLGAHGGVSGGANLFPRLYVDLYTAAVQKDLARVRELHRTVMHVAQAIYTVGRHSSAIIKGIKCALSCLDICKDFMAEPFHRFREPERRIIRERLDSLRHLATPE
jgi:4-hydroxy-tetrahydrodipicolinate synthase